MLKRVKYHVTFPSTGITKAGEHDFSTGLTTITGPNGVGKSLVLEFIRYALHGTKALRTTAGKYKGLTVELDFEVKGTKYAISRSASKVTLSTETGVVAVGTTAVNTKVAEIFGYGLDVFDASHAVNQGQIEALGSMKPSERKAMVDNVIGLNVLDALIKFAGETAALHQREADALKESLVEPVAPVKPENYDDPHVLQTAVQILQTLQSEKDQILGQLKNEPAAPEYPVNCGVVETAEELERQQERRASTIQKLERLKGLYSGIPDPEYTAEQLDAIEAQIHAYKAWLAYKRVMDAMPAEPFMDMQRVEGQRQYLRDFNAAKTAHERAILLWETSRLKCPACQHEWSHKGHEKPGEFTWEEPDFTAVDLDEQERRIKAWANAPAPVEEVAEPAIGFEEVKWQRQALAKVEEKALLAHSIKTMTELLPEDRSADLKTRRAYEAAMVRVIAQKQVWTAFQELKVKLEARLAEIGEIDLAHAQAQYQAALLYETQLHNYNVEAQRYQELLSKVSSASARVEQYKRAKTALTNLKGMVKSHLVPSLSRVASLLLSQMTNGRFTCLKVDEDFNIQVGGQDLDELSGSEKAVANLAVRIGLGQVLTNRVFPVFMGDELDAAMDDERAGFTAECLRNLTAKIPQVILVTHKRPEADHVIELGEAA